MQHNKELQQLLNDAKALGKLAQSMTTNLGEIVKKATVNMDAKNAKKVATALSEGINKITKEHNSIVK